MPPRFAERSRDWVRRDSVVGGGGCRSSDCGLGGSSPGRASRDDGCVQRCCEF